MGWVEHDYPNTGALIDQVARALQHACREAIGARGAAWLALAGGRTPLPIYARLAASPCDGTITAIPTDERCVPHDHPACNLRALREAFAANSGITAAGITREDGDEAASLAQARALFAVNAQPFDFVLLGMGADGHFASLFPGAANLAEGLAMEGGIDAIATQPDPLPPEAPFVRISLSLPRLLRAREVHLVVTGEDKRRVLRQAQQQDQGGAIPYPVAALLHARDHRLQIHWSP
ncbi:6-phosphogluconolactonase [Thermomonas aquatica]|uniref:6-phosphogluconolactonase n=1 Tax=Thermomonas aquatica TaxID=2202149 RepID=A0A5B7ZUF7_9GAMM|nr:6-phosphogluconolactonase [Thermomonas aquatica]QDA58285.1 6-phosphogluconolactonase [Thermomonas aquatica]